jgi:lysophospholipase
MPPSPSEDKYAALLAQERFQPPEKWDWSFTTVRGHKIRYGQARVRSTFKAVIVILGGLRDFGEQYFELTHELHAKGFKVMIVDLPGQGGSGRYLSNPNKRHSIGFDEILQDLHAVIEDRLLSQAVDPENPQKRLPMILLGHSWGGHLALRYLHDHNKTSKGQTIFSAAVLSAPMLWIHELKSWPIAIAKAVARILCLRPEAYVPGGTDWYDGFRSHPRVAGIFSSDPERGQLQEAFFSHPDHAHLRTGAPTTKWLYDAIVSCQILNKPNYLKAILQPILIGVAGNDRIVSNAEIRTAVKHLPKGELLEIPGAQHEILMEKDIFRQAFLDRFFTFLEENVLNKPDEGKTPIL